MDDLKITEDEIKTQACEAFDKEIKQEIRDDKNKQRIDSMSKEDIAKEIKEKIAASKHIT